MNDAILNHTRSANLTAYVDEAAVKPLPNSYKVYAQGSRPDIQVPMRKIIQSNTPDNMGAEENPQFMSMTLPALIPIPLQR